MSNWITNLEINNFKSIKQIKMDCKRINVFIGKPNVGKSNILEALSLYLAPFCDVNQKIFKDYIRYEKINNLFYEQDRKNQIVVKSNIGFAAIRFLINSYDLISGPEIEILDIMNISKNGIKKGQQEFVNLVKEKNLYNSKLVKPYYCYINETQNYRPEHYPEFTPYAPAIKNYHYVPRENHSNPFSIYLSPPFGDNLYSVLENNPRLFEECASLFVEYGLDLVIKTSTEKIEIQKKIGNRVYEIPYSLIADTLQRYIFHLAAIETNNDSIIVFEEPENHSFPPYISLLSDKIINSNTNQFFISTHSPYLLTPFIEQCSFEDIAIFITCYEKYETKVRELRKEEIDNIMETGIDLFYNIPAFQK